MSEENDDEGEIVKQLKEKFHLSKTKSEQVQVLTILPKSWSIRKVEEEFYYDDSISQNVVQVCFEAELSLDNVHNRQSSRILLVDCTEYLKCSCGSCIQDCGSVTWLPETLVEYFDGWYTHKLYVYHFLLLKCIPWV